MTRTWTPEEALKFVQPYPDSKCNRCNGNQPAGNHHPRCQRDGTLRPLSIDEQIDVLLKEVIVQYTGDDPCPRCSEEKLREVFRRLLNKETSQ